MHVFMYGFFFDETKGKFPHHGQLSFHIHERFWLARRNLYLIVLMYATLSHISLTRTIVYFSMCLPPQVNSLSPRYGLICEQRQNLNQCKKTTALHFYLAWTYCIIGEQKHGLSRCCTGTVPGSYQSF